MKKSILFLIAISFLKISNSQTTSIQIDSEFYNPSGDYFPPQNASTPTEELYLNMYGFLPSPEPSTLNNNLIHIVILSEAYPQSSYNEVLAGATTEVFPRQRFADDFLDLVNTIKNTDPFKQYSSYFRFYAVKVICDQPYILHPGPGALDVYGGANCSDLLSSDQTATSCVLPPANGGYIRNPSLPDIIPIIDFTPSFGSSLDKFGIHRGLASNVELVEQFIATYFGANNPNVFPVILSNIKVRAGTANISKRIMNIPGNFTEMLNGVDELGGVHELAHSFGQLQDDYFFECPSCTGSEGESFNCEFAGNVANRYVGAGTSVPTYDQLNWSHWYVNGIPISLNPAIGNFGYPTWASAPQNIRRSSENCKMVAEANQFCAVCREAIIERVHNLVNPINSFTPLNVNTLTASSSLVFNLDLTTPNPNTMRVIWELVDGSTVTTLETDYNGASEANVALGGISGTAGGIPSGVYRWNMNCAAFAGRPAGNYIIRARVYDMTGTAEDAANRWVRHPQHMIDANDATNGNHERKVEWTVYYNGIPGTDLYTSDVPSDLGVEPNIQSDVLWESPDIWVTNTGNPNGLDHENPIYVAAPGVFSYVHVNVKNRGCKVYNPTTDGSAQVSFYWAKAGTALDWPNSWNGTLFTTNLERGNLIGSTAIGTVDIATGATPAVINWDVPNPAPYATLFSANELDHFCVLSRIVAPIDPMTSEINTGLWTVAHNVKENNNIAWKNFTIVEELASYVGNTYTDDKETGTSIIVENPTSQSQTIRLKFEVPANETGKSIVDEAEVRVILSPTLWTKWVNGGQVASNITVYNASRRQLLITNETAFLGNIQLNSNEAHTMYVSYNFLTEELTTKTEFKLRAIQMYNAAPNAVIGGETYIIRPDRNRQSFTANAGGDKEIILGNNYQGIARGIGETAIFNWYDAATGAKLYTGGTFNVTANNVGTKRYKLETIAQSDGYKDYDVVNVTTILGKINSVAPNPANSGTFAINYSVANSVTTAKIKVININTNTFTENTISIGNGTLTLNVSNYANGSYSIVLICNNQTADSKLFVVN